MNSVRLEDVHLLYSFGLKHYESKLTNSGNRKSFICQFEAGQPSQTPTTVVSAFAYTSASALLYSSPRTLTPQCARWKLSLETSQYL